MLTNGHPVGQQLCLYTTNYLRLCIVCSTPSDETYKLASTCNVAIIDLPGFTSDNPTTLLMRLEQTILTHIFKRTVSTQLHPHLQA